MALDRILTTHVGSLPRPQDVVDQLFAEDEGTLVDRDAYARVMRDGVAAVVKKQVEAGVDVVSDGEMSKISYATYIRHRLNGFEIGEMPRAVPQDLDDFPGYKERLAKLGATPKYHRPICCAPISVRTLAPLQADLANLAAAVEAAGAQRAFMNAASPGVIAVFQPNRHYATQEAYIGALADAMRPEYEAIVAAGFDLQIDAPDIAMGRHIRFRDVDDAEFLRNAHLQIDALNHALVNIDPARVRMHICWGNYDGPHHHDVPLETIMPVVQKARVGTYVFEAANPRHAHEWEVWQATDIPDDRILAPGVIDSVCNFIEHPRLVAQRLLKFADIVGRDRVMAASDCGFGTFAGFGAVHPPIAYAKLKAMAEGAAMASEKLWASA